MNQNAMDIVEKQVENRSAYLENIMLANQDLSVLSAKINETTASLTEEGAIDLETLDDSGENAMPLLSAVSANLISTLRSKSVTGIFHGSEYGRSGSDRGGCYPAGSLYP